MSQQLQFHLTMEQAAGAVTFSGLKDRLLAAIQRAIKELLASGLPLPPKPEFLAACAAAFEKYVAAYDIPQLPDFIETYVDEALEALFLRTVSNLYDRFASA